MVDFFTANDIPGINNWQPWGQEEVFCSGKVYYVGQSLGLVVAQTRDVKSVYLALFKNGLSYLSEIFSICSSHECAKLTKKFWPLLT